MFFVCVLFSVVVKSLGPIVRLCSNPDSAFISCVFLGKVLNFRVCQFPCL